jgi:uncharacterized phiE125 gp8 family phage protein
MNFYPIELPSVEPVTLDEAKAQCRVLDTSEDARLEALITVAREEAERVTHRALCEQEWEVRFDRFPCDGKSLVLPLPPIREITIQYLDAAGVLQTWAPGDYVASQVFGQDEEVPVDAQRASVIPAPNKTWPETQCGAVEAVRVQILCGYDEVPATAKQAILVMIEDLFYQRGSFVVGTIVSDQGLAEKLFGRLIAPRAA